MTDGQKIACGFLLLYCGLVFASGIAKAVFGRCDEANLWIGGLCVVPFLVFYDYCYRGRVSVTSFRCAALLVACLAVYGMLTSALRDRFRLSPERFLSGLVLVAVSYWIAEFLVRLVFRLAKVNRLKDEKRSNKISENGGGTDDSAE